VIQDNKQLVIHGKPLMLSQAILNLMHNSIDAAREFNDKWIKIVVTDKENEVQISVIDSGRGISDEILKQIGRPFYTTKSAGNGNGLGINLARRVIEGHGGVFRYDPEHAHTKFDLCLPKNRAG
jgi:signal transduction histidine kinase